jgi:hypothetical protein
MQPWALQHWVAAKWRRRYPPGLTALAQPQPEPMHTNGCQYWKRWVPSKYVPYCNTTGVRQYGRKGEEPGERWRAGSTLQYPQTCEPHISLVRWSQELSPVPLDS